MGIRCLIKGHEYIKDEKKLENSTIDVWVCKKCGRTLYERQGVRWVEKG